MDTNTDTRRAIEAIILVADAPVEPAVLAQLLELPKSTIETTCAELAAEYEQQGRGFVLARVAGGYRFQSHPDAAAYIERFVLDGQSSRLSSAALETLAIVAYKQPISRIQIAGIRGVNVDGVMRTLQQRGYIDESGRDPGPGNAVLFSTTTSFLERLGLDSLDDLPPLGEFVPGADVVEALENGLRPEPLEAGGLGLIAVDSTEGPEPIAIDSTPSPESVSIDLTDHGAGADTALPKVEQVIEVTIPAPTPPVGLETLDDAPDPAADHTPFRSTPGHDGAGDRDSVIAVEANAEMDQRDDPPACAADTNDQAW